MNNQSLSHLSTLRQNVYDARKRYWECEFGNPYKEYEVLKNARKGWSDACCKYIEIMLDTECKECENMGVEIEEAVNINTLIMLEKIR